MRLLALCLAILSLVFGVRQDTSFVSVDVFVDSGDTALAAWQVEVFDAANVATLVGVEGGEPVAFREPPAYDPAALAGGRVILAALQVDGELPTGRVRVATLSFALGGDTEPRFEARDVVAVGSDGTRIEVQVEVSR